MVSNVCSSFVIVIIALSICNLYHNRDVTFLVKSLFWKYYIKHTDTSWSNRSLANTQYIGLKCYLPKFKYKFSLNAILKLFEHFVSNEIPICRFDIHIILFADSRVVGFLWNPKYWINCCLGEHDDSYFVLFRNLSASTYKSNDKVTLFIRSYTRVKIRNG